MRNGNYDSGVDEDFDSLEEEMSDEEELAIVLGNSKSEEEREPIYNTEALHEKLEDISWPADIDWQETLVITSDQPITIANVDDDLERELAIYNQALSSAQEAVRRFESGRVVWRRPPDYYAEMVKSDDHMAKVKEQLLWEQKQIDETEQRRKERESKKFSKQVQAEKRKERAQDKKAAITSVSKLRKQRQASGFAGDLDMENELEKLDSRRGSRGKGDARRQGKKTDPGDRFTSSAKSTKRNARDSKFGFGGPKRIRKQNDATSVADVEGYKPSRFDDGIARKVARKFQGQGKKKTSPGGGSAQKNRPGKARRQSDSRRRH